MACLLQDGNERLAVNLFEEEVLSRHVDVCLDALEHQVLALLCRRQARKFGRERAQVTLDSRGLKQLQVTVHENRQRPGEAVFSSNFLVALPPAATLVERGRPRLPNVARERREVSEERSEVRGGNVARSEVRERSERRGTDMGAKSER